MELLSTKEQPAEIMVVDDLEINQSLLAKMIESMGYIAIPALSGAEALALVAKKLPKLFLLDVTMPDMNGFELCEILKSNILTRDIPVIFISASAEVEDKITGFHLGGVDYISKPFVLAEVTARISTHLRMYEMQQQMEIYNWHLNKLINEQIKQIEEQKKNMLYALAKITESSSNISENHLENVKRNCKTLAQAMQFSLVFEKQVTNSFLENIEIVSPLHDIGKIAIPTDILNKPEELTEEEKEMVKGHTITGARILTEIYAEAEKNEFIQMAIDVARYHHEKWDGTGYPDGLLGEQIPLAARIVAVIECYDTLTGKRCYKPEISPEESMAIMEKEAGKSFDPDIFDVFRRVQKRMVVNSEKKERSNEYEDSFSRR